MVGNPSNEGGGTVLHLCVLAKGVGSAGLLDGVCWPRERGN